ncbi:hypothetical protein Q7P35_001881 [Cladosporium inversicolor]
MKSSATAAAIIALSSSAVAVNSRWSPLEAVNIATGQSIGYLWSEANGLHYSNPVYGDARHDFMFINDGPTSKNEALNLKAVEASDEPSAALMRCARENPSPCSGAAYFEVGGGQWESGHYLVRGGFRYPGTPGYKRDEGFHVDNYNNATGTLDFKYAGTNDRNEGYVFYACGDIPKTGDDEPNGDLFIKYASEPTRADCQDVRLQVHFAAGTGTMDWVKPYECEAWNDGIC